MPYSNFSSFPTPLPFSLSESSAGSHMTFSCRFCLISSRLWKFLALSLSFMTWTHLKSINQLFFNASWFRFSQCFLMIAVRRCGTPYLKIFRGLQTSTNKIKHHVPNLTSADSSFLLLIRCKSLGARRSGYCSLNRPRSTLQDGVCCARCFLGREPLGPTLMKGMEERGVGNWRKLSRNAGTVIDLTDPTWSPGATSGLSGLSPFEIIWPRLILPLWTDHWSLGKMWPYWHGTQRCWLWKLSALSIPSSGDNKSFSEGRSRWYMTMFHQTVFQFKIIFPLENVMYLSFWLLRFPLAVCIHDSSSSFRNELKYKSGAFLVSFFLFHDLWLPIYLLIYCLLMGLRAPERQEAHKFGSPLFTTTYLGAQPIASPQ